MDIIDELAGLAPDSNLRAARPVARENAQKSYEALFVSPAPGLMPLDEKLVIATFVAGLHGDARARAHYQGKLAASPAAPLAAAVEAALAAGMTEGPYGAFPPGPLSAEDQDGLWFKADAEALGPRLAAAFDHAHLLVFHPRDAGRPAMLALAEAGWSATDIVTLSQMISFLSFQIRAGIGLRVLAATA